MKSHSFWVFYLNCILDKKVNVTNMKYWVTSIWFVWIDIFTQELLLTLYHSLQNIVSLYVSNDRLYIILSSRNYLMSLNCFCTKILVRKIMASFNTRIKIVDKRILCKSINRIILIFHLITIHSLILIFIM